MRRIKPRPVSRTGGSQELDPHIQAWWDAVLADEEGARHPILSDDVKVRLEGDRLILSGELDTAEQRDDLVAQAHARTGQGFSQVEQSRLKVAERREKPGLLEQTLIAAFRHRATAVLARNLVCEQSGHAITVDAIVDHSNRGKLKDLLPADYIADAERRLDRDEALLIIRVDETSAFKVRALVEEETRSKWAVATPPELIPAGKR
jgi:hypothetical protein